MMLSLALGLGMYAVTLCVLMAPTVILIQIAASRGPDSLTRPSFRSNFVLLQLVATVLLVAHLVNIALWAVLFCVCREFADFPAAYYHSAVNYSSLGYGDVVMSPRWRLLGPLETMDGIVMVGISTALMVAVISRLIERRMKAKEAESA